MKTNKERAKIIMQRYANKEDMQVVETSQKPKSKFNKFLWTKKAIVSVCTACVMLLTTLGLGLGLGLGLKENYDLNNMYIYNFQQYTALGAGVLTSGKVSSSNVVFMASSSSKEKKLIGIKENGVVEEVRVKKKKEGKPEKIKWDLTYIFSVENFTIARFCKNGIVDFNEDRFIINKNSLTVIIDNKTGKIYSLNALLKKTDYGKYIEIRLYSPNYDGSFSGHEKDAEYYANENYIYFFARFFDKYVDDSNTIILYKASVVENSLKIEQILDKSVGSNMVDFSNIVVDRYGNLFLSQGASNTIEGFSYIINKDGLMKRIEQNVKICLNKIVYTKDKKFQFDENGKLVENSFDGCDVNLSKIYLIKKDGNIHYFYIGSNYYVGDNYKIIHKITWLDDVRFEYEKIQFSECTTDYVVTADKIFFRNESKIFSVDIASGEKTDLVSDYYFTSIDSDNLGNVTFSALDSTMQNVYGLIRNDGRIETSVVASEYEVYYINALN